jgi:hypothetical protein
MVVTDRSASVMIQTRVETVNRQPGTTIWSNPSA